VSVCVFVCMCVLDGWVGVIRTSVYTYAVMSGECVCVFVCMCVGVGWMGVILLSVDTYAVMSGEGKVFAKLGACLLTLCMMWFGLFFLLAGLPTYRRP